MMITKTGSAKWQGGIKDGRGEVSTESGVMCAVPYGFNTRFEGGKGTNPEELIAAAHAACFSMALSKLLGEAGVTNIAIDTHSDVSLDKEGDGFAIKTIKLTTRISGQGDEAKMLEAAERAKAECPVSKVLNAQITMDAKIA